MYLDTELEHKVYTLSEIHTIMRSLANDGPVFGPKYLKSKLLKYYQDEIYFTSEEKRKDILCFRDTTNSILREFKDEIDQNSLERTEKLIKVCAKLLISEVKAADVKNDLYPGIDDLRKPSPAIPESLKMFLAHFTKSEELADIWAQNFIKLLRPRSGVMPFQLGLALLIDHRLNAKWLIELLHSLGYCESYQEVNKYKWLYLEAKSSSVTNRADNAPDENTTIAEESDDIDETNDPCGEKSVSVRSPDRDKSTVYSPMDSISSVSEDSEVSVNLSNGASEDDGEPSATLLRIQQYSGDNIDLAIRSLHGNKSFHAMGRICISTPKSETVEKLIVTRRSTVTKEQKIKLLKAVEIKVIPYHKRDSQLNSITFKPFLELLNSPKRSANHVKGSITDSLWHLGWIVNSNVYRHMNFKGFNKTIHPKKNNVKSEIIRMPIIDADPNSYSTIYTTLLQCLQHADSKPIIITFDFPIWIKAVDIVLTLKLPVIARLGGFHLLTHYCPAVAYATTDFKRLPNLNHSR